MSKLRAIELRARFALTVALLALAVLGGAGGLPRSSKAVFALFGPHHAAAQLLVGIGNADLAVVALGSVVSVCSSFCRKASRFDERRYRTRRYDRSPSRCCIRALFAEPPAPLRFAAGGRASLVRARTRG